MLRRVLPVALMVCVCAAFSGCYVEERSVITRGYHDGPRYHDRDRYDRYDDRRDYRYSDNRYSDNRYRDDRYRDDGYRSRTVVATQPVVYSSRSRSATYARSSAYPARSSTVVAHTPAGTVVVKKKPTQRVYQTY